MLFMERLGNPSNPDRSQGHTGTRTGPRPRASKLATVLAIIPLIEFRLPNRACLLSGPASLELSDELEL